jgi:hypothetical protein
VIELVDVTSFTLMLNISNYYLLKDTLLALQALKQFSFSQTNRAFYNLQLEFVCSSNDTWHYVVSLDKTNFATLQSFPVSFEVKSITHEFRRIRTFYVVLRTRWTNNPH